MFDYEKLVGSIYDCAANPELWPDAGCHGVWSLRRIRGAAR